MENLIQFIEFETSGRGRKLGGNSLSVWYNLDGKNKSYGVTFSNDIKTDKRSVKVGKFGDEFCFVFTNEPGIKIYGNVDNRKNIVFNSRGFVETIYQELKYKTDGKKRKVFQLKKLTNDIYVIESEKLTK